MEADVSATIGASSELRREGTTTRTHGDDDDRSRKFLAGFKHQPAAAVRIGAMGMAVLNELDSNVETVLGRENVKGKQPKLQSGPACPELLTDRPARDTI
jgi:hypothetical protein